MKTTITATLLTLFLAAGAAFSQNRDHRVDRDVKTAQMAPERRERAFQPRVEHRTFGQRDRGQFEHRGERRFHDPRVVIVPRLSFRFPFFYRGYRVNSMYDYGFRDGFYRGRQDFRAGFPCDPEFEWNYRNSEYERGYLAGYAQGCNR